MGFLVRGVAVTAAVLVLEVIGNALSGDDGGANIGLGMLLMAVPVLISAVWAVLDGRRDTLLHALLTWVGAAVVHAVLGMAYRLALYHQGDGWADFLRSESDVSVMLAMLVLVPSVTGVLVGRVLRD